jgi:transcription antitermination factor NusG
MLPPWAVSIAALAGGASQIDICQVKSSHEKALAWRLLDEGIGYFLPYQEARRRSGDRSRLRHLPTVPGYIFLSNADRGDVRDRLRRRHRRDVLRFIDVVSPRQLVRELEQIHSAIQHQRKFSPCDLKAGDVCRIIDGPFKNHLGKMDRAKKRGWVILTVTALGQPVPVEIEIDLLEPV